MYAAQPLPGGATQASTLAELMSIRAFHGESLRRHSLGTALGLRIRNGEMTDQPAIIVFVARKVSGPAIIVFVARKVSRPAVVVGHRSGLCHRRILSAAQRRCA